MLRNVRNRLTGASPSPALDAELLLAEALVVTRINLYTQPELSLDNDARARLEDNLRRRLTGEPIAYITGRKEFWSLDLKVTPATLVPRPETELLVAIALELLHDHQAVNVADLGTGSGAIALALAHERSCASIKATDISSDALAIAQHNATALGITNVQFNRGAWFEPLAGQCFDMITANPPYVAIEDADLDTIQTRHEPPLALFAGTDGLSALRIIIAEAPTHIRPDGYLILEHGHLQGQAVRDLLCHSGFHSIVTRNDLADLPRVSVGRR
ncbi:MAG: protein-(glutamine-N5) methyltransferase, release factor-specific [Acidiferrobacteraceae bacterium]|nr:protein-(glutamine-N5) methyltransferase, release factor-specific [Acidiferrobacteraceae bacterium]